MATTVVAETTRGGCSDEARVGVSTTPAVRAMRKPRVAKVPNSRRLLQRLTAAAQRKRPRLPARHDVSTVTIADKFVVSRDVGECCASEELQAFVRRAASHEGTHGVHLSTLHAKASSLKCITNLHAPRKRLVLVLGRVASNTGGFTSCLHPAFARQLLSHMEQYPAWKEHTAHPVERYDFVLGSGICMKTLYVPREPYVCSQATVRQRVARYDTPLHHPHPAAPTHLRWQLLQEQQCDLAPKQPLSYSRVRLNQCYGFSDGAWVYKVTESWEGRTCEQVQQAQLLGEGHIQISLELHVAEHPRRNDATSLAASALCRMRDLLTHCSSELQVPRFRRPRKECGVEVQDKSHAGLHEL